MSDSINFFYMAIFFILGTILGSFANVAIYRYFSGESLWWPGSKCPSCQTPIKWFDLIPIISWFVLSRKCRKCQTPISAQYPLVEFVMGILFLLAYLKFGISVSLIEILLFFLGLVIVSAIDLKVYLLPDVYTLSGLAIGLIGSVLNPERSFYDALAGVLLGGGFPWFVAYLYYLWRKEEGLGGGDIKLLAWMGAVLGWQAIPFIMIVASVVGSLAGLWAMRHSEKGLKTVIPFGPFLSLGALIYALGGQYLAHLYIEFLLPGLF